MYQKVSTDLNFVDREKEVSKFWKENDIFQKSMESRRLSVWARTQGLPGQKAKMTKISLVLSILWKAVRPLFITL